MELGREVATTGLAKVVGVLVTSVPVGARVTTDFDHDLQWWSVQAEIEQEGTRAIRVHKKVIAGPDTDWDLLLGQLRATAQAEFADPAGCVVRVFDGRGPRDRGGFRIETTPS